MQRKVRLIFSTIKSRELAARYVNYRKKKLHYLKKNTKMHSYKKTGAFYFSMYWRKLIMINRCVRKDL